MSRAKPPQRAGRVGDPGGAGHRGPRERASAFARSASARPRHSLGGGGRRGGRGGEAPRLFYEEHGRHEIFAGGKKVALDTTSHSLKLDQEAVNKGKQTDLDEKGIAKTAREEKLRARKAQAEHQRMAEMYRQVVLKEPKPEIASGLQIQGLKKKEEEPVAH